MKKVSIIGLLFAALLIFIPDVEAEVYKRGIAISNSVVKTDASSSASNMLSDIKATMTISYPEAFEIIGEKNDYYQIRFMWTGFIYVGYIPKANVMAKEYIIDDNYKQEMINKGFPEDYAKKLAILHAIHPNWIFTPSFTGRQEGGMDFKTAVDGEASVVSKNLLITSNTSLLSTADGAYKNGQWIALSGGGNWYAASWQTISFYMDPRNFLDESHIFMFEQLAYSESNSNRDTIEKSLAGSFMTKNFSCIATSERCTLGEHSFVDTFISVGQEKKVSPTHLVSRVLKEQGPTGSTLSLGAGWNGQYVGYYNFFNINASGSTTADVLRNGFEYAVLKKWNNQYVSILDGSNLIASNYIGNGQSTVYYQKFNTITPTYFGNQYMQNIRAPYDEAYQNTYTPYVKTYSTIDEWDKAVFEFLIPVYKNMGASTSLDVSFNSDATLKSLNIPECKLNPDFQSSVTEYDCYVPKTSSELNISAETTNVNAKVEYASKVTLTGDEQTVEIKVTAVNGMPSTYTIRVHRIEKDDTAPDDILNNVGYKVNGNDMSNIAVGSDVSNILSSITNSYHFATVTITEEDGTKIDDGTVKTGQKVTVTNADVTKTYNIVIYADVSVDGEINILDLLAIQKYLLKAKTLTDSQASAADVNKDNKIDILDLLLVQKYILGDGSISQG